MTEPARRTLVISASSFRLLASHRDGLIKALQDAGYAIVAAAPEGPGQDELRRLGAAVEVLPMRPTGLTPFADIGLWRRYLELFRRLRPAAFLGFTAKPNIYGTLAARRAGIPTVNNISGLGRVFTTRSPLTRLVEHMYKVAFRGSPVVFFENRDDAALFVERGIVRPAQVVNLPGTGIDLAHYRPGLAETGDPSAAGMTFLFAARLLWEKGVGEFVAAGRAVRARIPDARFQILGFVEPRGKAAVPPETLDQWQDEGAVEFLGSTADVRPFIARSDCVVLPSYYREGIPRILMEAAAMAKPVITTDMPGCREAVRDGVTGLMCQARSVESLAAAMERLARMSEEQRHSMGSAGRARMEAEFRGEIVHRAYLDALGKLGVAAS